MSAFHTTLQVILLILVVLTLFNLIIFVHELGHFLAARWRGLQVDRFQIWFGKPIWKKEINGVQYGLGWIPAGGFVALPQMAPMEAIEGGERPSQPLPPISALDKIIVAFAGPLFSMLLAFAAALVIWQVGKPKDFIPTQQIGYVLPDSAAAKAGLQAGDTIIAINGQEVHGFAGSLDSITERIVLSSGEQIVFLVKRPGIEEPIRIESGFKRQETKWWQRSSLREVGIDRSRPAVISAVIANGPADRAGLKKGDRIVSVDGQPLYSLMQLSKHFETHNWQSAVFVVEYADGRTGEVTITPMKPLEPANAKPMIGISWDNQMGVDTRIVNPGPLKQIGDSLMMVWTTVSRLVDRNSDVGIDHLSGPVGIGTMMYDLLQTENGWRRIIFFMVIFNVNLALINMLPFPVLDGGHITLAVLEKIAGRPVKAKVLEVLQTACAIIIFSLFLYITSKDLSDHVGGGGGDSGKVVFPE